MPSLTSVAKWLGAAAHVGRSRRPEGRPLPRHRPRQAGHPPRGITLVRSTLRQVSTSGPPRLARRHRRRRPGRAPCSAPPSAGPATTSWPSPPCPTCRGCAPRRCCPACRSCPAPDVAQRRRPRPARRARRRRCPASWPGWSRPARSTPGQFVAHPSGRYGIEVLDAGARRAGALPLALHPAMTFTGTQPRPRPARRTARSASPPRTPCARSPRRWSSRWAASRSGSRRRPARCTTRARVRRQPPDDPGAAVPGPAARRRHGRARSGSWRRCCSASSTTPCGTATAADRPGRARRRRHRRGAPARDRARCRRRPAAPTRAGPAHRRPRPGRRAAST